MSKPKYQLILDKIYKYGDILTPDPEFGDQMIVLNDPTPTEIAEYPGNFTHAVMQVTNDPSRKLPLDEWVKDVELTKISYSMRGEYDSDVDYFFFGDEAEARADRFHEERQTFCKITADTIKL